MKGFLVQPGQETGECDYQPEPANEEEAQAWAEAIASLIESKIPVI